jgi:S-adenosylmethionine:tRNA ribosyltransferase-isomerase
VSELAAIDYLLPSERIAQEPVTPRDAARLLFLERATGERSHAHVRDLPRWLRPGDLLVRNATRVLPARLRGRKESGGAVEALVIGTETAPGALGERRYRALVRAGGRHREGLKLVFEGGGLELGAEVAALHASGEVTLAFFEGPSPYALGETPLPPYIRRESPCPEDAERYQTVFARVPGSVAAPTAGLHLTPDLFRRLAACGVSCADVVLHVGPGTFRPVSPEALSRGRLHAEAYELPAETVAAISKARESGGRVVAVGTTTTRVLEHCAALAGGLAPGRGETELLLRPGSDFRIVDGLLTNFHLPRSSLLLLVAGFGGRERVLAAYREAIATGYRFYSYGDAMLVL